MLKILKFSCVSFIVAFSFVPALSFAQTVTPEISLPNSGLSCPTLSINLYRGLRDARTNGAVSDLQQYLADTYNVDPDILVTGYFGPKTEAYVKHFQAQNNIQQTGVVGPVTRVAILRICGGGGQACTQEAKICPDGSSVGRTGPNCEFAVCPNSPISATTISANPMSIPVGGDTTLTWRSTNSTSCRISSSVTGDLGAVPTSGTALASHFTSTATITLTCTSQGGTTSQAQTVITVGSVSPTTQQPTITSLSPSYGPIGTTVTINGGGFTSDAVIYFNGQVVQNIQKYSGNFSFVVPSTISNCPMGAYCFVGPQPLTPGTYSVLVKNSNGTSNSVSFTVTSGSPSTASLEFVGMKDSYSLGEPIDITIRNNGTVDATLSAGVGCGLAYFQTVIRKIDSTNIQYNNPKTSCGSAPTTFTLRPGETKNLGTWDQKEWMPTGNTNSYPNPNLIYGSQNVSAGSYSFAVYGISKNFSITDISSSVPIITTTSLPSATVGVDYIKSNASIVSSGGSSNLDWNVTSGALPPGIYLNMVACATSFNSGCSQPATIGLFGAPTSAGTYTFTITLTSGSQSVSKQLTIVVNSLTSLYGQYKWWFDSVNPVCSYKQFYGLYMYQGLQTFDTQDDCQAHLLYLTPSTPSITSLSPNYGAVDSSVTIYGNGFTTDSVVLFDGHLITTQNNITSTNLSFTVPTSLAPNCSPGMMCAQYMILVNPGTYMVSVKNKNGTSNQIQFTVTGGMQYYPTY